MPYRFLDDIALADVAVEATGGSLEEVFTSVAEALLKVQIENVDDVRRQQEELLKVSHTQVDMLLYRFLQELVFLKDAKRLLLRPENIVIESGQHGHQMKATMSGEPLDSARHKQGVDVKAVTLHLFEVVQTPTGWKATVVLDI
jgi:SHS2 domain-containing protein